MNQQLFINGQAKFPVSTETLDFIQNQIFLTARLCSLAGQNVIITPATATTDGLVVINGELLPLLAGTAKQYIQIVETKQSIVAGTQTFTDVRIIRHAQYANSGTPVSQFTTIDNIVRLMQRISTIEDNYLTETAIRALVQTVQTNLNTTNGNLTSLASKVNTLEATYMTRTAIEDALAANAQHHLPKGSVIDWSHNGYIAYDDVPYGYIPCGKVIIGMTNSMNATQLSNELNKWRNHYSDVHITNSTITKKNIDNIFVQYNYIQIIKANGVDIPDLTDRFIVQAGHNYSLGNTGGDNEITLTTQQMPQHIHGRGTWNSQGGFKVVDLAGGLTKAGAFTEKNRESTNIRASGSDDNWRVTVEYDWAKGLSGSLGTAGGSRPHENRPPYYALYKLIKVI